MAATKKRKRDDTDTKEGIPNLPNAFELLGEDILLKICENLTLKDLDVVKTVCKYTWRTMKRNKQWIMEHHRFIQPHGIRTNMSFESDTTMTRARVIMIEGLSHNQTHGDPHLMLMSDAISNTALMTWNKRGQKHRDDDLPASITTSWDGKCSLDEFTVKGTELRQMAWYQNGELYRKDGKPSKIVITKDAYLGHGVVFFELSWRHGDRPAVRPDGNRCCKMIIYDNFVTWYSLKDDLARFDAGDFDAGDFDFANHKVDDNGAFIMPPEYYEYCVPALEYFKSLQ